jgi:tRNA(Phe) wybutosine-synthesizing methylase Tyw3
MSDKDIVTRLRLTPVLMRADELGQSRIDYEACKKYVNDEGVKLMREAANEIERLRNELEDAKIQLANMEEDYFRIKDHNE